jgi:hypothetical protein
LAQCEVEGLGELLAGGCLLLRELLAQYFLQAGVVLVPEVQQKESGQQGEQRGSQRCERDCFHGRKPYSKPWAGSAKLPAVCFLNRNNLDQYAPVPNLSAWFDYSLCF